MAFILSLRVLPIFMVLDADCVGCPDTRRSPAGYCMFIGSNCISWSAKKQPTVARSSAETKFRSIPIAASQIIWISSLLKEVGVSLSSPLTLFCDNLSALYLTANPMFQARRNTSRQIQEKMSNRTLISKFIHASS